MPRRHDQDERGCSRCGTLTASKGAKGIIFSCSRGAAHPQKVQDSLPQRHVHATMMSCFVTVPQCAASVLRGCCHGLRERGSPGMEVHGDVGTLAKAPRRPPWSFAALHQFCFWCWLSLTPSAPAEWSPATPTNHLLLRQGCTVRTSGNTAGAPWHHLLSKALTTGIALSAPGIIRLCAGRAQCRVLSGQLTTAGQRRLLLGAIYHKAATAHKGYQRRLQGLVLLSEPGADHTLRLRMVHSVSIRT